MISVLILMLLGVIISVLFVILIIYIVKIRENHLVEINNIKNEFQDKIKEERKNAVDKSRSVLKGKISEQVVSLYPEFFNNYNASDARFLGSPVDYIIFKNMSSDNFDNLEIVLLDVKTGNASLTKLQKAIKIALENNRIKFDVLRINDIKIEEI